MDKTTKSSCCICGRATSRVHRYEPSANGIETIYMCDDCTYEGNHALAWLREGSHVEKEKIVCPYCGCEGWEHDRDEIAAGFLGVMEIDCDDCGKPFVLGIETKRLYTTWRRLCDMPKEG